MSDWIWKDCVYYRVYDVYEYSLSTCYMPGIALGAGIEDTVGIGQPWRLLTLRDILVIIC